MTAPRLLALDMDGTLLNSRKQVSPRTAEALERLTAAGVPLCFCTGRNVGELGPYIEALSFIQYGVLVSGAVVRDLFTGEIISIRPLELQSALEVAKTGKIEDAMVHVLCVEESFLTYRDLARLEEVHMDIYRPLYENWTSHVQDIESVLYEHQDDMLKVNLYHATVDARDRSRARLSGKGLMLADAEQTSVECTASGISKAEGLAVLCRHLGCTLNEAAMIGDAGNDLEALSAVGFPVAMGNAEKEVKDLAQLVVADCDHDGIVEAIDRLF